ncbi:hypothetical protein [Halobacillus amylolyticus]|uniref:hypothetical protein n=1 Tax=Halobacillus amylolyticus TaxID=2932259 RepID=UPI002961E86D|nr:hypothetical protein [Halobacillus amylolyticus]
MNQYIHIIVALCISMLVSYLLVFPVIKLAVKWRMMDHPEYRKIHKVITPRMGDWPSLVG